MSAEEQDGCIFVDGLARIAADLRQRFTKGCEHLPRKLEAEDMALQARIRNVIGQAPSTMPGDDVLHLTRGPSPRGIEPRRFGGRRRHARQLTRDGEANSAGSELTSNCGQLFERFSDAELFLRETRAVAENALGVFLKGGEPEPKMRSRPVSLQEPASLLEIEPRSLRSETNELFMCPTPRGVVALHDDC